nr:protein of unknown function (DUF1835) [uncultured bacterium]
MWLTVLAPATSIVAAIFAVVGTWINNSRNNAHSDRLLDRQQQYKEQEWISQRWWEKQAETYSRIIQALRSHLDYPRELEGDYLDLAELTQERGEALRKEWKQSRDILVREADIGDLYISEEAASALRQYIESVVLRPGLENPMDEFQRDFAAAEECLKKVKECAVRNLRIQSQPAKDHGRRLAR